MLKGLVETTAEIDEKLETLYKLHLECPINLTSVKEREEFYLKHYLDSIYYFSKYGLPKSPIGDIGSGGGFPGLVIAIFNPKMKVSLIESVGKKCKFLTETVERLSLKNVEVINARAEEIKDRKFATITARGVSSVKELLNDTWELSAPKTSWVLYKGEKITGELEEASVFLKKRHLNVKTYRIEEPFTRTYCVISR